MQATAQNCEITVVLAMHQDYVLYWYIEF